MKISRRSLLSALSATAVGAPFIAHASAARRVIALDGALSEIIFRLGKEALLIAVDQTAQFPAAARALPNVGYHRALSAEGVLAMKPDLIVMTDAAGPPRVVEQIAASGVEIVRVPRGEDREGVLAKIRIVADAVDAVAAGERLRAEVERDFDRLQQAVAQNATRQSAERMLFLLSLPPGAPPAAGVATSGHSVIRLLGGTNVFGMETGYKPVSAEALAGLNPDVVFIADHQLEGAAADLAAALNRRPDFAALAAVRAGRVRAIPSTAVLGFGPRTPAALIEIATWLNRSA
jgi:iron complex transport system substrate-binding protein